MGLSSGRPAGSLLTEALMAVRGLQIGKGAAGLFGSSVRSSASNAQNAPFLSGGLAGAVGRRVQTDIAATLSGIRESGLGSDIGTAFYKGSLGEEGGFASQVIGSIATGQVPGIITADDAAEAYGGYFADAIAADTSGEEIPDFAPIPSTPIAMDGEDAVSVSPGIDAEIAAAPSQTEPPVVPTSPSIQQAALDRLRTGQLGNAVTDVEIGGGKITGKEIIPGSGQIRFAMYNARQFEKPTGHFTTHKSLDGQEWYKVYAVAGMERTPTIKGEDGKYKVEERKIAVLPKPPARRK